MLVGLLVGDGVGKVDGVADCEGLAVLLRVCVRLPLRLGVRLPDAEAL